MRARFIFGVVVVVGVVVLCIVEWPILSSSFVSVRHMQWEWLPLAIAAEAASMMAAARRQRRLLSAGGVDAPLAPMAAITYAGNAISVSVPVAGSEMATAYTYRQFRDRGVQAGAAMWTLTMSGVASTLSFGVLFSAGALVSGNSLGVAAGFVGLGATLLPMLAVVFALRSAAVRGRVVRFTARCARLSRRLVRYPKGDPTTLADQALDEFAGVRLGKLQSLVVLLLASWNWIADILCLAISIHAVGAVIPWRGLVLVYAAGLGAGSTGMTPGGLGLVEVALAAALTRAGVHSADAVAAVFIYRIVSFWLVIAVGWLALVVLRGRDKPTVLNAAS